MRIVLNLLATICTGPLAILAAYAIKTHKPYRHIVQATCVYCARASCWLSYVEHNYFAIAFQDLHCRALWWMDDGNGVCLCIVLNTGNLFIFVLVIHVLCASLR